MKRVLAIAIAVFTVFAMSMSADAKTKKKSSGKSSTSVSAVKELNMDEGFASDLYPVFIEIYKPGYAPSTRFKSTFARAASKFKGKAQFYRLDITKYPELIDELSLYDLPYVWIFTGPDATASFMGEMPLEYLMMEIDGLIHNYRTFDYDYQY